MKMSERSDDEDILEVNSADAESFKGSDREGEEIKQSEQREIINEQDEILLNSDDVDPSSTAQVSENGHEISPRTLDRPYKSPDLSSPDASIQETQQNIPNLEEKYDDDDDFFEEEEDQYEYENDNYRSTETEEDETTQHFYDDNFVDNGTRDFDGWTVHEEFPHANAHEERNVENVENNNRETIVRLLEPRYFGEEAEEDVELVNLGEDLEPFDYFDIPETPAREALSKAAGIDDVTDPIIYHLEPLPPSDLTQMPTPYESQAEPRMHRCPSILSMIKPFAEVNVYLIASKKLMISKECRLDTTMHQLKEAMGRYLRVPADYLDLRRKKGLVPDGKTLAEIGAKAGSKVRFTVELNKRNPIDDEIDLSKKLEVFQEKVLEPKGNTLRNVIFNVKDETGKEIKTQFFVEIVHSTEAKRMLGGFYDMRNNKTYHHAATSPPDFDEKASPEKPACFHEACQTFNGKELWTQTKSQMGVQTERPDYYISAVGDRVIHARKYISSDQLMKRRLAAVIILQKYWRRYLAIKERRFRLAGLVMRVKWAEDIRKGRHELREKIRNEELERQLNPRNLLDLEFLYRAINKWKAEQEEYIRANRWGAERKAALAQLAEMESDLLLDLEKARNRIINENRDKQTDKQFRKMGEPLRWLGGSLNSNYFVSIDSQGRGEARHLRVFYTALKKSVDNSEQGLQDRMHLLEELTNLIKCKQNVMKVKSQMSGELISMINDLIGRELRFISANASQSLLVGVRKRISNTFYRLCRDPGFNSEAKRCETVPYDRNYLTDMVQCKGCKRIQYRSEFTIIRGTDVSRICRSCTGLYRTTILRVDLNLYRQLLRELRQEEYQAGVVNSVTFLMDPSDMKFLVEQIWHGQSALSGIDDRYLLSLCRWRKNEPWSPWNCVLLTEEESTAHMQLTEFEEAYQTTFVHKIEVKHTRAKMCFKRLIQFSLKLDPRISDKCKKPKGSQQPATKALNRTQGKRKSQPSAV